MAELEALLLNQRGLHARAAARVATLAQQFPCETRLNYQGRSVNAKSMMGIMMLGAACGSAITLTAEGDGADSALAQLAALIADRFGEPE